jgi:hypothetical protein
MPSNLPVGRQQRLKAATGAARAEIVTAEFLGQLLAVPDDTFAALDVGLAEGTPCDAC